MSVQEFCLIPKKIVEDLNLNQTVENNKNNVYLVSKKISTLPYSNPSEYNSDLKDPLKSILKTNFDKGYTIFLWLKDNEKKFQYLKNGDLLAPITDLNILTFINDAVSKTKSISKDQMNKYKLFISITNMPEYLILNTKLKEYLYPTSIQSPKKGKKRSRVDVISNINSSPISLRSKKQKAGSRINYITSVNPIKFKKMKKNNKKWLTL